MSDRALWLSEASLSTVFWQTLRTSSLAGVALDEGIRLYARSLDVQAGFPGRTGSLTPAEMADLWLLARYFEPRVAAEVGTYIGRSTTALVSGAGASLQRLHTCDLSFDCWTPPEDMVDRIEYFGRTGSTDMLRELHRRGRPVDFFFLDGRVSAEDVRLVQALASDDAVVALDDFEGTEKGVANAMALRPALPQHLLLRPVADGPRASTTAVLVPARLLRLHAQQGLPLGLI